MFSPGEKSIENQGIFPSSEQAFSLAIGLEKRQEKKQTHKQKFLFSAINFFSLASDSGDSLLLLLTKKVKKKPVQGCKASLLFAPNKIIFDY